MLWVLANTVLASYVNIFFTLDFTQFVKLPHIMMQALGKKNMYLF
jgi:hypothetical protein